MTDADRSRYLRRLRFPPELESAFQQDYYRRFLPALRIILLILVLVVFVIWLRVSLAAAHFDANLPNSHYTERVLPKYRTKIVVPSRADTL